MIVRRLPRPTAFVFGGGASCTAAQVGMLAAVQRAGIRPDLIVGTSAGALNGVVLAHAPASAVDRLTAVWTGFDRGQVIAESRVRQFRNMLGGHYMFGNGRLAELFGEQVGTTTFSGLEIPFACVATDLESGSPITLRDGDLETALLATCAIPGVFPLVRRGGRWLADGAYVANVPVRQALDLGAASIVVFDGRPRAGLVGDPSGVREAMTAAFAATLKAQYDGDVEYARSRGPVLCLPGQSDAHVRAFDFSRGAQMIRHAREQTELYLRSVAAVG